jgi:hypothetical protein
MVPDFELRFTGYNSLIFEVYNSTIAVDEEKPGDVDLNP